MADPSPPSETPYTVWMRGTSDWNAAEAFTFLDSHPALHERDFWSAESTTLLLARIRPDPTRWRAAMHLARTKANLVARDLESYIDAWTPLHPEVLGQAPTAQQSPHTRTPHIVTMSTVQAEPVTWLWEPYIPLRKLTILEGDPGVGKTWLALQIAACLSQGYALPGPDGCPEGPSGEAQHVLYLSAEDGLADTLRPRLDAAGADCNRVHALVGWRGQNAEGQAQHGPITLADLEMMEAAMAETTPALVIVDPLQGYLGATVDMYRANEVRPILARLAALAEAHHCAVVGIRHLSKALQSHAVYRGLGSIDFAAAARSILLAGQDPQNPKQRVLAHVKSSLAPLGPSVGYELHDGQFLWTGHSSVTAEQLLSPWHDDDEERSARDEATDFLWEILADGPRPAQEVIKVARQAGITERTLQRAKQGMPVVSFRQSVRGEERGKGLWVWQLQDGHLGQEAEPTLQTGDGHLEKSPQGKQLQQVRDDVQDGHVAILNDRVYPQEINTLQAMFKMAIVCP